jgi:opacity protein-like surface antigen
LELSISTILSWLQKTSVAILFAGFVSAVVCAPVARAADDAEKYLQVFIAEPYLELSTGPGRGYPVFHAVARDASVDVLFRRTDWFKVRDERGVEGWAKARDMARTLLADGTPFTFNLGDLAGFTSHRWELGIQAGDYGGADLIGTHTAFSLTDNMKVELALSQFLGNASNGYKVDVGLNQVIFPEWRVSPFITLGTGVVKIEPRATLVQPADRTDQTAYAGAGVRLYLARRFFVRAEYRWHTVFTSRNDNEELREWKVALACFF